MAPSTTIAKIGLNISSKIFAFKILDFNVLRQKMVWFDIFVTTNAALKENTEKSGGICAQNKGGPYLLFGLELYQTGIVNQPSQ